MWPVTVYCITELYELKFLRPRPHVFDCVYGRVMILHDTLRVCFTRLLWWLLLLTIAKAIKYIFFPLSLIFCLCPDLCLLLFLNSTQHSFTQSVSSLMKPTKYFDFTILLHFWFPFNSNFPLSSYLFTHRSVGSNVLLSQRPFAASFVVVNATVAIIYSMYCFAIWKMQQ